MKSNKLIMPKNHIIIIIIRNNNMNKPKLSYKKTLFQFIIKIIKDKEDIKK